MVPPEGQINILLRTTVESFMQATLKGPALAGQSTTSLPSLGQKVPLRKSMLAYNMPTATVP